MKRKAVPDLHAFMRCDPEAFGKPIARLGLASHGDTAVTPDDVLHGLESGIGFLNWPGLAEGARAPDAFSEAIASLGSRRDEVVVCAQFGARSATHARAELTSLLGALNTNYIDVLTLYYVEETEEWDLLRAPGGVLEFCRAAQRDGVVRRIGLTSHQRRLAAQIAQSGEIDLLMIRYNAAHRGAERDIFPVTRRENIPVISYTATRWGALMRPTRDDPPNCEVPRAPAWYRFALQELAVSVVLCAPHNRAELEEDLTILSLEGPLSVDEHARLAAHGERVRNNAGHFV